MLDLLQAVLDGLLFGTTYALIGIGFTLVFGVMHKLNMSYAAASVGGAYCGLLIMGLVQNAMNLLNIPPFYQYVARGCILLAAVMLDRFKQRN